MIQKRTTEPSKNSVHAPWIHAAGILTALWLMIVFLITAVEAVAYWTPGYYKMDPATTKWSMRNTRSWTTCRK